MKTTRGTSGPAAPLAALLALALAAAACGGPPPGEGGAERGAPKPATALPRPAPDFALRNLEGETVRLSDTAGKVRLVDFWATWCAPCREAIPGFKELYGRYRDRGFEILAISMDEDGPEVVRSFVEREGIPYTNLMGDEETAEAFGGVLGLPATFLIDGEGRIVESWVGGVPKRVFEERIRRALGMEPA